MADLLTCGKRKIWWNIKESENIMNMIAAYIQYSYWFSELPEAAIYSYSSKKLFLKMSQ